MAHDDTNSDEEQANNKRASHLRRNKRHHSNSAKPSPQSSNDIKVDRLRGNSKGRSRTHGKSATVALPLCKIGEEQDRIDKGDEVAEFEEERIDKGDEIAEFEQESK